jgi:hypothetical protein
LNRLLLAAALLFAFPCLHAKAQLGVYGKLDLLRHTDTNSNSSHTLYGGGVGLDYTFFHAGPLRVGADVHGDAASGDNYSYRSLLFGLPVGVKFPVLPLKPYIEPVAGVGGAKYTGQTAIGLTNSYTSRLTYGFVGGVAFTVLPHVDWRVIEVGYTREKSGTLPDPNFFVSTALGIRF